jgi:hypothetical protein
LDPSSISIVERSSRQFEGVSRFKGANEHSDSTATRLRAEFKMRDVAGLSAHYSSATVFKSAISADSQVYVARKLTAVASVASLNPRLSAAMLHQIEKLPRWSTETDSQYRDFFASYGTHVILRAALGGILRIVAQGEKMMDEKLVKNALEAKVDAPILSLVNVTAGVGAGTGKTRNSVRSTGRSQVTVFRDGGGKVSSQLTEALEKLFTHIENPSLPAPSDWTDVRMKWIDALDTDPVFCADDGETDYQWIYNCDGLTSEQRNDLKQASEAYLRDPAENGSLSAPPSLPDPKKFDPDEVGALPREKNLVDVDGSLSFARKRWKSRFGRWVKFWKIPTS